MIRAETTVDGTILHTADLVVGGGYYVDADWLPRDGSAAITPLVVGPDLRDADEVAGAAFVRLAERAVAAVGTADSVVVLGSGTVARHVRRLLATGGIGPPEEGPPSAVVEATGDPGSVAGALRQVASLGTVILVGEQLGRDASLNLYSDLHVRGLTLVGLARPLPASPTEARSLPDTVRTELARAAPGVVLPRGAGWYRLSA